MLRTFVGVLVITSLSAYFDHWLGQRPVSEEMKRALLHQREEAGGS